MSQEKLAPELVAAITAAVSLMLDNRPEEVRIAGIRPVPGGAPGGWPSLWGLAGRQAVMNARQAVLSAARKEFRSR